MTAKGKHRHRGRRRGGKKTARENAALDALIVLAFHDNEQIETLEDLKRYEKFLTPEDNAALAALGPDLVKRIIERASK